MWLQNTCNRIQLDFAGNSCGLWGLPVCWWPLIQTIHLHANTQQVVAAQYWPNWTPTAFFWPLNVAKYKLEQAESLPDDLLDSTACVSWGIPEAPGCSANALKQEFALKILAGKIKKQIIPGEDRKKVMNEDLESFEINRSPDKELCDVWVWRLAVWKINWIFFVCLSFPPLSKKESLSCLPTLSQQLYPQDGEQQLLCQLESANRNVRLKGQNCQTQLQFHLRLSLSK